MFWVIYLILDLSLFNKGTYGSYSERGLCQSCASMATFDTAPFVIRVI